MSDTEGAAAKLQSRLRILTIWVVAFFLAAGLVSCRGKGQQSSGEENFPDRKMVEFTLPRLPGGEMVTSGAFKDRVLLVTFFATYCQACLQEIEILKQLQNTYGDKGLEVIGISVDPEDRDSMASLIREADINYPVLEGNEEIRSEFGPIVFIPTSFLVDRKGMIVQKYAGNLQQPRIGRDIVEILE